jgi:hypothetical protein
LDFSVPDCGGGGGGGGLPIPGGIGGGGGGPPIPGGSPPGGGGGGGPPISEGIGVGCGGIGPLIPGGFAGDCGPPIPGGSGAGRNGRSAGRGDPIALTALATAAAFADTLRLLVPIEVPVPLFRLWFADSNKFLKCSASLIDKNGFVSCSKLLISLVLFVDSCLMPFTLATSNWLLEDGAVIACILLKLGDLISVGPEICNLGGGGACRVILYFFGLKGFPLSCPFTVGVLFAPPLCVFLFPLKLFLEHLLEYFLIAILLTR